MREEEREVMAPWATRGCKECGGRGLYISEKEAADYYRIRKGSGGDKDFFRICRACIERKHIKDEPNKGLSPNKELSPKGLRLNKGRRAKQLTFGEFVHSRRYQCFR
jgi:hypothetical protein